MTKKAYVIGSEAGKSLSPLIFNYWFQQSNIKAEYLPKEIEPKNFNKEIDLILKDKEVCGFNVTTPYKEKIIKKLNSVDEHAQKIGAVNFVTKQGGLWVGKNTDWKGFIEPLQNSKKSRDVRRCILNKPIIIGYGGAAKAIIYALQKQGIKEIKVFNRSYEKIKNLNSSPQIKALKLYEIKEHLGGATLIVNTTPKNIFDDWGEKFKNHLIFDDSVMGYDIVYNPKETAFLSHFIRHKRTYGINMLVCQAAPCFEEWFDKKPTINKELYDLLEEHIS